MTNHPFTLMSAPNGARRTKVDHPTLPIGPRELAETAVAVQAAGANAIHIHVRGDQDQHTLDVGRYREAIAAIKEATNNSLLIQSTTEAVGIYNAAQQMQVVRDLMPDAVSLALQELVPEDQDTDAAQEFLGWLYNSPIQQQFILYSADDVTRFHRLCDTGLIPEGDHNLLFVLGRYTQGQNSNPSDLDPFIAANTHNTPWSACAFGVGETACLTHAIKLGGSVRVGFENSLWHGDGTVAHDNAERVAVITKIATEHGRMS